MKEVKLFNLLSSITKKEFDELENYVNSKIFNTSKSVIRLYNFISANYEASVSGKITKYQIFSAAFENEKYSDTKYWKIAHSFSVVIDKYLSFKEYEGDYFYQKNRLLEAYRSRNINKQYSFLSKEIQKSFDKEYNKGLNFLLNQTHFYFQNISYLGPDIIHELDRNINKFFENLTMFFIMTNITSVSIIANLKKDYILSGTSDIWMFEETLKYLRKNRKYIKKHYIAVYIFFLIVLSKINFKDEKYYFEARKLILSRINRLSKNLLKHMLLNILDYAVSKMERGDEKFLKEIFFINKVMDEHSLTLTGEYIHSHYYYAVIEHSTLLGERKWAMDFANKYKKYLSGDFKESSYNLGVSRIHFENKNYDLSMQLLLKVDNLDPYFYFSHKILLIQNYYETGENAALNLITETSSKYLKRRIDISAELKKNYEKFLYYFRKLRIVTDKRRYLLENFQRDIQKESFFIQKKWILEKVADIKKLNK
ncbi:MAG: hypothetical protein IPM38_07220 [Ignavibacteria bacterium]|nr:hypothetical protein [Ignavibacteria bacterium]